MEQDSKQYDQKDLELAELRGRVKTLEAQKAQPQQERRPTKSTNNWALWAFLFALLFWPLGLVFSVVAISAASQMGGTGRGLAWFSLALSIAAPIFWFSILFGGASQA